MVLVKLTNASRLGGIGLSVVAYVLVAAFYLSPSYAITTVWTGGAAPDDDFLNAGNWTMGVPGPSDSGAFNNDLTDTITFSASVDTQDLFLQNTSGTITFDVGAGNKYTMSRFTILGSGAGETNHVIVPSGELESGILFLGNDSGSSNNQLEVMGADTMWLGTGTASEVAAIRVGSNGGDDNTMTISGGATVESATQIIVGLQGASNNQLTVTGLGTQLLWNTSLQLGGGTNPLAPQSNNDVDILAGATASGGSFIIGVTGPSPDNTLTVSGAGSQLTITGTSDIGRTSTGNSLLVENGGTVNGSAFVMGRDPTSTGNLLSINNGTLTGTIMEVNRGSLVIDQGDVTLDSFFNDDTQMFEGGLVAENGSSSMVTFNSGTLNTPIASVNNGSTFQVGDGGGTTATYRMTLNSDQSNGTHSFADDLFLNSNGVLAGSGDITGNVSAAAGASVDIGDSPGLINVAGDWDNTGITITAEIADLSASTDPGVGFDQLDITGGFTHGGDVVVDLTNLVDPAIDAMLKLIGWTSEVGNTNDTNVSFVGGTPLTVTFQADGLFVEVPGTGLLLGDANKDGQVTGADLISVQQNFGNVGAVPLQGDANNDGQVTGADLISVQQNFGNVLGPASAAVPEPATLGLLALAGLSIVGRRTRDR